MSRCASVGTGMGVLLLITTCSFGAASFSTGVSPQPRTSGNFTFATSGVVADSMPVTYAWAYTTSGGGTASLGSYGSSPSLVSLLPTDVIGGPCIVKVHFMVKEGDGTVTTKHDLAHHHSIAPINTLHVVDPLLPGFAGSAGNGVDLAIGSQVSGYTAVTGVPVSAPTISFLLDLDSNAAFNPTDVASALQDAGHAVSLSDPLLSIHTADIRIDLPKPPLFSGTFYYSWDLTPFLGPDITVNQVTPIFIPEPAGLTMLIAPMFALARRRQGRAGRVR